MRFLFLALLAIPFFIGLGDASVWDANESFYVQTPREMLERDSWIVPYFNDQPRLNKPPLSYWVVAFFYSFFEDSLFWERLPMALLGYGSVLLLYWIGTLLLDSASALWGAGILATTFRFLILSRRLFIDVLLLFCLLAAVGFFLSSLQRRKSGHLLISALFFGLAFLAKGPVCLLPVPVLLVFALATRRWNGIPLPHWLLSALLFAGVAGSWFLMLGLDQGWTAVADFFVRENLGRYTHLDYGPSRGPFYYAGVFLGDFFPWSILFLGAALWLWRSRRERGDRPAIFLLLLWVGTFLLFFSFSSNKQEYYILPAYPAAALLVGFYLSRTKLGLGWRAVTSGLVLAAAALAGFLFSLLSSPSGPAWAAALPLVVTSGCLLAGRFGPAILSLTAFYALGFLLVQPALEAYKPVRHLAPILRSRLQSHPGQEVGVGYYQFTAPSLTYYLNRPILELYDREETLRHLGSQRPVYLLIPGEEWEKLSAESPRRLEIVASRPKLYTTARSLVQGFQRGEIDDSGKAWSRPVLLITNQARVGPDSEDQSHHSGLQ